MLFADAKFFHELAMIPYKPSLPFIVSQLKGLIPQYEEMLAFIEDTGGLVRLPDEFNEIIERLMVGNYPELYRDEQTLTKMIALSVMPAEQINAQGEQLNSLPEDQRPFFVEGMIQDMTEAFNDIVESIPVTDEEKQAAQKLYDEMSPEEQAAAVMQTQISLSGFISSFFNIMSVMVHGRKLTDLVKAAEEGDDTAFCLAVQIDKRILTALPYFRERHAKALISGHTDFLDRLHYRQTSPLLRGKIRYRTLWLAFAYLDMSGHLDGSLKHREILDICDEAGVGGDKNNLADVGALSKRLREYRKFQQLNQKSRH